MDDAHPKPDSTAQKVHRSLHNTHHSFKLSSNLHFCDTQSSVDLCCLPVDYLCTMLLIYSTRTLTRHCWALNPLSYLLPLTCSFTASYSKIARSGSPSRCFSEADRALLLGGNHHAFQRQGLTRECERAVMFNDVKALLSCSR